MGFLESLLGSVASLAGGVLKDALATAAARTNIERARGELRLGDQQAGEALLDSTLERLKVLAGAHRGTGTDVQALRSELDLLRAVANSLSGQGLQRRGREAEAAGKFTEAIRLFGRVPDERLTPRDQGDYGVALAALGRDGEAREHLTPACDAEGATPEARRHLARLLLDSGDTSRAERLLEEALQIVPADADALALLGRAQQLRGHPAAATTYQQAAYLLLQSDRAADARRVLDAARGLMNDDNALRGLYAEALRVEGRNDEAAVEFDRLLGADPDNPWLLGRRGVIRAALGQPESARADLARAADLALDDVDILLLAGQVALELGDPDSAQAYSDRALAADSGQPAAYALRARAKRAGGSTGAALDDVRQGRALAPQDADLLRLHAYLEREAGNPPMAAELFRRLHGIHEATRQDYLAFTELVAASGKVEEAEKIAAEAVHRWPDDPALLELHGSLLWRLGRLAESIRALREAVRINDRSASAWLLLGLALGEVRADGPGAAGAEPGTGSGGDERAGDQALAAMSRSVELTPSWAEPYYRRGQLLAAMNLWKQARPDLEAALARDPGQAEARALLVVACFQAGELPAAEEHARILLARSPLDERYLLLLARALVGQGRHGAALDLLAEPPGNLEKDAKRRSEWLLLRARALLEMFRWNEAEQDLTLVVQLQPELAEGWVDRAELARKQGKALQALEYADRALFLAPGNVQALGLRGAALLDLGQRQEARAALSEALDHDPDYVFGLVLLAQLIAAQDPRQARALIEHGMTVEPDNPLPRLQLGWLEVAAGAYEAALEKFDDVLTSRRDVDALYGRAETLRLLGRSQEAIATAMQALELRPDHPEALRSLGFALLETEDREGAISVFRRALAIYPQDMRAATDLGYACTTDDQIDEALELLDLACVAAPRSFWALSRLARVLLDIACFEGAERLFRRVHETDPGDAASWTGWGWALQNHTPPRLLEAEDAYRKAVEFDPGNLSLRLAKANIKRLAGQAESAEKQYRELLEQAKGLPEGLDQLRLLGECSYRLGDFKAASRALYELVSADPRPDGTQFDLALALFCDGRSKRGIALYQNAVALIGKRNPQIQRGFLAVAFKDFRDALHNHPSLRGPESESVSALLAGVLATIPPAPDLQTLRPPDE